MPAALHPSPSVSRTQLLWLALALSMGAAVSLGITRFAYALLLPPMRADLGWSYTLAGAMNTVNALGYLLGALATPLLLRRGPPGALMLVGAVLATLFMGLCGFFLEAAPLLLQRLLAGVASAFMFITGGLMAARLGALDAPRSGLLLGLYYGGTGWGISLSALLVPAVLQAAPQPHAWTWAWWALALACGAATALLVWPVRVLRRMDVVAAFEVIATVLRYLPFFLAIFIFPLFQNAELSLRFFFAVEFPLDFSGNFIISYPFFQLSVILNCKRHSILLWYYAIIIKTPCVWQGIGSNRYLNATAPP